MAEFNSRVQQKGDTQSNFETNNPILLENELVVVKMTDGTIKFKIGNGTSNFNDLEYTDKPITDGIANINNSLNNKANINSPTFTGTPTAPTPENGDNSTKIATTAFVVNAMSSSGGGTEIVVSTTQPPGQSVGDFWYKEV